MLIEILRLVVDFGLVVLIWTVQLIIYPSFLYYSKENLVVWHKKYTYLIGRIVSPLMLFQLGISIYQITLATNLYTISSLVIVGILWTSTVLQFVPIHKIISDGTASEQMLLSLETKNWIRTFLWTLVFLYSFLMLFSGM